jgi:hypothetical protein
LAALAVAVKGPFGLLPLGGVLGARVLVDRSWRHLGVGALVFVLAIAPVAVFLALRPDWREGYGVGQLLASATGERTDGRSGFTLALSFIAERFWPWLPLLFLSLVATTGKVGWLDRQEVHACRKLAVACALVLFGLSLPHRKIWHHTLVAYPLLSVLIGVTLAPLLARLSRRRLLVGLWGATALSIVAVACGVDRLLMARPCVLATDFSDELLRLHPGDTVPVISAHDEWDMLSALAFEQDVRPLHVEGWDGVSAPIVLATEEAWRDAPAGWSARKQARGWVLAVSPEPPGR